MSECKHMAFITPEKGTTCCDSCGNSAEAIVRNLQAQLAQHEGAHTCSAHCQREVCVLRRRVAEATDLVVQGHQLGVTTDDGQYRYIPKNYWDAIIKVLDRPTASEGEGDER